MKQTKGPQQPINSLTIAGTFSPPWRAVFVGQDARQGVNMPQSLNFEVFKSLCVPRNLHLQVHKGACLPQGLHFEVLKARRLQ